jgi:lysine 2,3-aminomutase
LVRTNAGAVSIESLRPALQCGGDPLTLSTPRLGALVREVRAIPSIELVRIATRTPAVMPMRIDAELVEALRPMGPIWFMVHFNHPKELTFQARKAIGLLVDGGFPVMSQTVLLRGVNDNTDVLKALLRSLVNLRVRPYYLLHGDVVAGSEHLRTTVARSIELIGQLQGSLSGIAVPKLVIDTPGGKGKVVVGPETIVYRQAGITTLRTFRGEQVDIVDPEGEQTR